MQLVKERQDLQNIVEFVATHKQELKKRHAAYVEYLEAVREARITTRNVYTNEKEQRKGTRKRGGAAGDAAAKKEEEERKKLDGERVKTVMTEHAAFARIVEENASLAKYIEVRSDQRLTRYLVLPS